MTTGHRLGTSDTSLVPIALGAMLMGTATPPDAPRRIVGHVATTVAPRYRTPDGGPALAMTDTADCSAWWQARGAVDRVASAVGATGNQVVLAWLRAARAPSVLPLVGPRTVEHHLEDVESLDPELTVDQLAELDAAGAS